MHRPLIALTLIALLATSAHAQDEKDKDRQFRAKPLDTKAWKTPAANKLVESTLAELHKLPLKQRLFVLKALSLAIGKKLFAIKPAILKKYTKQVSDEGKPLPSGMARILERSYFDGGPLGGLVPINGNGAYYSFTSKSHDYQKGPDIELQGGKFFSGFYGSNHGSVVPYTGKVKFGKLALAQVPEVMKKAKPGYRELRARAAVAVGTTYFVRAIRHDEADTLTVMRVVDKDDYGVTFIWRMLKRYPVPRRR